MTTHDLYKQAGFIQVLLYCIFINEGLSKSGLNLLGGLYLEVVFKSGLTVVIKGEALFKRDLCPLIPKISSIGEH
jgi:hypothetical protein